MNLVRPRLARRHDYLLTFGIMQLALGVSYTGGDTSVRVPAVHVLLPDELYLAGSVLAALAAILAVVLRNVVHPPWSQRMELCAFALLCGLALARCLANVGAAFVLDDPRAITGGLIFLFLTRVHLLVAGWPEPAPPGTVELRQDDLRALADELRRRAAGEDPA